MINAPEPIKTYKQFVSHQSPKNKIRNLLRSGAILALSRLRSIPQTSNWLRFPYYHHVFDDERAGFDAHLRYMKNFGDFIGLDDAVAWLASDEPIQGRYFCITFDDGFRNCLTNAMPILLEHEVKAAFFLPTRYIGASGKEISSSFYKGRNIIMEFLSWEDCKQMVQAGMTIGSHTVNHVRLSNLSAKEAEQELSDSKKTIEDKLGQPCLHFCCPVGIPGTDFLEERDPKIAQQVGYKSFLTTKRGSWQHKSSPMLVEREHTTAIWKTFQLRYFFSL